MAVTRPWATCRCFKYPLFIFAFVDSILPCTKVNFLKLVLCCLEFLNIKVSLVSKALFPKSPYRFQITNFSKAIINQMILLLGAGSLPVLDTDGLGNLPDTFTEFIIFAVCCQATLLLPDTHGCGLRLADSITSIPGSNVNR